MPSELRNILILGGTVDARRLAERLQRREGLSITTSLAGITQEPEPIAGRLRTGGFGGVEGLRSYLESERIDLLIDAVHPFAARMSTNAVDAAAQAKVPCLRLERPRWVEQDGDRWIEVADIAAAAEAVPVGARAFVTVGRQEIAPFFAREDIAIVARMIEPPDMPVPNHAEIILARPPFTLAQESELLESKCIDVLVTKNSGGDATISKVLAARERGLPVIMVRRPGKPETATARSVEEMLPLIDQALA